MIRRGLAALLLMALPLGAAAQQVSAVLEPAQQVEIRASVPGRIAALLVAEGDAPGAGIPLAAIDAEVQRARVDLARIAAGAEGAERRAELAVAQAQALVGRLRNARAKGAAKAWEVTQAENTLALAQADAQIAAESRAQLRAQLALEEATLRSFEMRAPFDGRVLQIFVEPGETVGPDTPILEFGRLSELKAVAFVPADWARRLTPGDSLSAQLGDGGQTITGLVAAIDPRIDPASQSVRLRLSFDNAGGALSAGASIRLQAP